MLSGRNWESCIIIEYVKTLNMQQKILLEVFSTKATSYLITNGVKLFFFLRKKCKKCESRTQMYIKNVQGCHWFADNVICNNTTLGCIFSSSDLFVISSTCRKFSARATQLLSATLMISSAEFSRPSKRTVCPQIQSSPSSAIMVRRSLELYHRLGDDTHSYRLHTFMLIFYYSGD